MNEPNKAKSILIEIGVEDLPAKVFYLADFIARFVEKQLLADGFKSACTTDTYDTQSFFTPRRLAFRINNVIEQLPQRVVERKGPALEGAYDSAGNPTPSAIGFAKSCGVEATQLEQEDGRLICRYTQAGERLDTRLEVHLQNALTQAPLAERMRWADHKHRFIRPIHWLLAMFGDTTLDIKLMDVRSANISYGHRTYCDTPLTLTSADSPIYEETLENKGNVIVCYERRQRMIKEILDNKFVTPNKTAQKQWMDDIENFYGSGYEAFASTTDNALSAIIKENAAMIEYPYAVSGSFDPTYVEHLPRSIIIQALMKNQHFFLGIDDQGQLLNQFLTITDAKPDTDNTMLHGFERVARPRLADAMFFLEKDKSTDLATFPALLNKSIFHEDLGSLIDKSSRLENLSQSIALLMQNSDKHFTLDTSVLSQSALMCKFDLMSATVNEYPALEGEVGKYCLRAENEVANAIAEHYMPRHSNASLPSTKEACILALADRMDTLVGVFGIGNRPTGSKDPYALRRASIAMIRLLLRLNAYFKQECTQRLNVNLFELIDITAQCYQQQRARSFDDENILAVKDYLLERMKNYYAGQTLDNPLSPDQIDAVFEVTPENLFDFDARLNALNRFYDLPQMQVLAENNKRIKNILRKNDVLQRTAETADESLLQDASEHKLYQAVQQCRESIEEPFAQQKYLQVLECLVELHQPISQFFDEVLIMVEDERLRNNRITLLCQIRHLFMRIGDFSKLNIMSKTQ